MSGVKKEIIKEGTGPQVQAGNNITVQCTGSLTNPPKKFWRFVFARISSVYNRVLCLALKIRVRNRLLSKLEWDKSYKVCWESVVYLKYEDFTCYYLRGH